MISQPEADALIAMKKSFINPKMVSLKQGIDETYELIGEDQKERFFFDLWRGVLRLSKYKLQTRGRILVVLVRLDINGSPHTNPDGQILDGTHLHIYKEGFGDKWAYPMEPSVFEDISSVGSTFRGFCKYCNIEAIPYQEVLGES